VSVAEPVAVPSGPVQVSVYIYVPGLGPTVRFPPVRCRAGPVPRFRARARVGCRPGYGRELILEDAGRRGRNTDGGRRGDGNVDRLSSGCRGIGARDLVAEVAGARRDGLRTAERKCARPRATGHAAGRVGGGPCRRDVGAQQNRACRRRQCDGRLLRNGSTQGIADIRLWSNLSKLRAAYVKQGARVPSRLSTSPSPQDSDGASLATNLCYTVSYSGCSDQSTLCWMLKNSGNTCRSSGSA
jgi:hypothetical protein